MVKRFLTTTLLFICKFQIALGGVVLTASDQADALEQEIHTFKNEIERFRVQVQGKESTEHCPEEIEDSKEVEELISQVQKNSCGGYELLDQKRNFSLNHENDTCTPIKEPGLLDVIAARILASEKRGEKVDLELYRAELTSLYNWGKMLGKRLHRLILNPGIENQTKQNLVQEYVEAVPLGIRDLVTIKKSYEDEFPNYRKYYDSLLPVVPAGLYQELTEQLPELERKNSSITPYQKLMFGSRGEYLLKAIPKEDFFQGWFGLEFNEAEMIIRRDIGVLLKALNKRNYMTAIRMLTVFMMAKQIRNYEALVGYENLASDRTVSIPKSCQNKENGFLPKKLKINFSENQYNQAKIEKDMIYKMLFSEGLIGSNGKPESLEDYDLDPSFEELHLNNFSIDSDSENGFGTSHFDEYIIAKKLLKYSGSKVNLADRSQFSSILALKLPELEDVYQIRGLRGKRTERRYKDFDRIQQFLTFPGENKSMLVQTADDEEYLFYPFNLGLNQYLANLIQKKGVLSLEEIIPNEIKHKLKAQTVRIPFPKFYGSGTWRQKFLNILADFVFENKEIPKSTRLYKDIQNYCLKKHNLGFLCENNKGHYFKTLSTRLEKFRSGEKYLPIISLESKLLPIWRELKDLWQLLLLRHPVTLEDTFINQYEFILGQIKAGNRWATLKLSYLVAKFKLETKKEGFEPSYISTRRGRRYNEETTCFYGNIKGELERLIKFGKKFKLQKQILPFHGDIVLKEREKKILAKNIITSRDLQTGNLYNDGQEIFEIFKVLKTKILLNGDDAHRFSDEYITTRLSSVAREELDQIDSLELTSRMGIFKDMYKLRDDSEKQYILFKQIEEEFDDYEDNSYLFKSDFLKLNDLYKMPLYKDLFRKAALNKTQSIYKLMNKFCQMDSEDHETLKAVFHSTSQLQNQMNEAMGVEAVPDELLDLINSMPTAEKWDMALGITAVVLGVSVLLLTAGTVGIGGVLAGYISLAARGALGMQIWLVPREARRKLRADKFEAFAKDMQELGFAEDGASDKLAVGWTWTGIEAISILPLIGVVARGMNVGDQALKEAFKTKFKNKAKVDKLTLKQMSKDSGQTVALEKDVLYAEYILGFRSATKDLSEIFFGKEMKSLKDLSKQLNIDESELSVLTQKIHNLEALNKMGKISSRKLSKETEALIKPYQNLMNLGSKQVYRYQGGTIIKHETSEIYQKGAEVLSQYFSHRPESLLSLLKSYDTKWFSKFEQLKLRPDKGVLSFGEYKNLTPKTRLEHMRLKLQQAKNAEVGLVKSWFREIRYGHIVDASTKLTTLTKSLEEVVRRNGDLQKFLEKNIKEITYIFKKIPMRKREIPYAIALQGGPHLGVRIPFLGALADGIMLRKITNAISRLGEEALQREARTALGMNARVGIYPAIEAYQTVSEGIGNAIIATDSVAKAQNLLEQLKSFEDKVFKQIYNRVKEETQNKKFVGYLKNILFKKNAVAYKKFISLGEKQMKQVLFAPGSIEEKAISEALWKLGLKEEIIWEKPLAKLSLEALEQLKSYQSLDQFWEYLRLFRMVVGFKDRGVVEII